MRKHFSIIAFLLCCSVIIGTALWYPKWEKPQTEATLSWDVMGYYLYLPAAIIYKDLKTLSFKDKILETYRPTSSFYQAFPHESGNFIMKYPIGMAILYLPFFLIAHFLAGIGGFPTDGFSLPYQMGISWGSIFMAFVGLWMMRKILRLYFSELAVGLALLLLVGATNYLNYTAIDGSMSHNWVFTLVAILIWQTIKWYQQPTFWNSLWLGCCIGLAALSRPTDILIALIPVFWGLTQLADFKDRIPFWKKHWQYLLFIVCLVVAIGSLQLFYWKYASGDWLVYSYQDQGFSWLSPHVKDVLISYRKGWLVYTPIMLLALVGFYFLYKNYRFLFWGTFAYFIIHFYITAAWDIWWYGGAFGQRALIQAYPVLLFPLASLLDRKSDRMTPSHPITKILWKWGLPIFAIFCIWLNGFQTYQAHSVGFEVDAMTKAYYWRIFGNTNPTILDKKLLDTKEDFQRARQAVEVVFQTDFDDKEGAAYSKDQALSGSQSLVSNPSVEHTPSIDIPLQSQRNKWLRVQAQFFTPQKEWEVWRMTQMIVQFKKGEEVIKKRMIRVHRQIGENSWQPNWTDMKIPTKDFDTLSIVFWNAGSEKTLYIDDLVVEVYAAE